jgi:uncharacterized damage-inducible protein DinB
METLNEVQNVDSQNQQVITTSELLEHWQGHRGLTRRLIEVYPEEHFFTYNIGGMRPFSDLVLELLAIGGPGLQEIVSGNTTKLDEHKEHGNSKAKILEMWDEQTEVINANFNQIPVGRFHDTIKTFGEYEGTVLSSILYFIDNEIHHRGQAYVYLRSLGIEPPYFWER